MPAPARDSVFISYSHRDRMWLDWIHTFLKPFTRAGTLSVWSDAYIEGGGVWRRDIETALDRAAVGLLLVSPHFLASDFIMDEELPALVDLAREERLRLMWVPVSASHWKQCMLKDYQAAWSTEAPLDTLLEPQRNAALVQITEAVAEAAGKYVTAAPATLDVPFRERLTVSVRAAPRETRAPGKLHYVPTLPLHFVPRADDLGRLRRLLLESASGALGITAEPGRMGLHGQGGIGKSVLAAALARDEEVRRAFPDGIFWVTVGQAPDLPRLQSALLAETGTESTSVTETIRGRKLLEERLAGRAVLLVLDDVWDPAHARAFDALGPAGRLLVTTRDGAVLTAIGAHPESVQRLPDAAALALLAGWAGADAATLPSEAPDVARECGYLPLALALAGARVREGTPWEVVLAALRQGRLEFLDHPYGSVFGSMRLSVDALPKAERQRYLELAVFPEDTPVPESVVLALWKRTAGLDELAGRDLVARFRRRALLEILDTDGKREVALHDLQHDFARIGIRDLPALHSELLAALAADLPDGEGRTEWWRMAPGARYAWVHLAGHMVAASRGEELRALLFDCRWLEAKLRAVGLPAVLADFDALPLHHELTSVKSALSLSGHVLDRDPGQLRSQLTGRLLGMSDGTWIRDLLQSATHAEAEPWLRPLTPSLTPPAGALLRTFAGHSGWWVKAVAMTPDGRRAISGADGGALKVWNLETGMEERHLGNHSKMVTSVAVTPDGRRAISASRDRTLKVWDLETGAVERTLVGHSGAVSAVAVTPDGRRAVSGSADGTLKIWKLDTGAVEHTLRGHRDAVSALAVTPDGRRIVSAASDRMLKVWTVETGLEERTFETDAIWTNAMAVTPDGRRVVLGLGDGRLSIWDLPSGTEERLFAEFVGWIASVAVTPDGRHVVSGAEDGVLTLWDLKTGAEIRTFDGHSDVVNAVATTPDGRHLVSGSDDGTLKLWDLETGAEAQTLPVHTGRRVAATAVTGDGRRAISGGDDGTLTIWNAETGVEERTFDIRPHRVAEVAMTLDGRRAVLLFPSGPLVLWNLETGTEERTLAGPFGWIVCAAVAPDGRRAFTGSNDGKVTVWNLETGAKERTIDSPMGWVNVMAVTPDGRRAVATSTDRRLKVWDLAAGAELRAVSERSSGVKALAVTPDARFAVSCSDWTLKVWDLSGDRVLAAFTTDAGIRSCAIAPDGARVVAGDRLGRIHFLSLESLPPE